MKLTDALSETADKMDKEGIAANVSTLLRDARASILHQYRVSQVIGEVAIRYMKRCLDLERRMVIAERRPVFIDPECGDGW
ncbi:hypothetical protein KQX64_06875 [Rhodopseudomonas palustris]|nr:hypothetical protein KQX64_06875 [Rhodopseudomonas palustris]